MKQKNYMKDYMDDIYHADNPICQIIPTCSRKRADIFTHYRPQRGTCLDYTISQTDAKFDAGDTKIHVQQTLAEYVPSGKKARRKKKIKYFSGGPPKWVFIDEIWRRKMEKMQVLYHVQFKERVKARKLAGRLSALKKHNAMLALVGPEWFQELSPKQLATVDNLKNCILKDLAEGSIINTTENIGALGLVLRPNHKCIERALRHCCKCPVEFLLILYQLIDPNRKKYSLNDRLLLSAVVHLTMTDTLRELHVRIPSPPPLPKTVVKKTVKKKKATYESPYLEPYTFERPPPKFTGIYCNKHRQYPESPYFSYLEEFRNEQARAAAQPDEEVDEETEYAQFIYEQLVDFRPVPILLKPSRYTPCYNFRNKKPQSEEPGHEDILAYLRSLEQGQLEEENEAEEENEEATKFDASQNYNCEVTEEEAPAEEPPPPPKEKPKKIKCKCGDNEVHVKKPSELKRAVCECKAESKKFINQPLCQCDKCIEKRRNETTTPIIDRMKEIEEEEEMKTIPIIDAILAEQPCKCLKEYDKRVSEYEQYQKRKDLVYDTVQEEKKFIIGGVVNRPDGPVFIVSDLLPKYECVCNEIAREEEAERRHLERMPHVPPHGRFVHGIEGVKETEKGNVYILNSTLPCEPCDCMKVFNTYEQEHISCLDLYDRYMEQMQDDMENFLDEPVPTTAKINEYAPNEDEDEEDLDTVQGEAARIRPPPIVEEVGIRERTFEIVGKNQIPKVEICPKLRKVEPTCPCPRPQIVECEDCTCGEPVKVSCTDCTCGPPPVEEVIEEEEEEKFLTRFFIFKKIFCNYKWQMDVIQKALQTMAEDDFPLAKLPDCHKLPHFKLWMQLRCGKYWTLEDKYASVLVSKGLYRHLDFCRFRPIRLPKLPVTKAEASLYDWSKAAECRKVVDDTLASFYRKIAQNNVDYGREYFPAFFTYPFPFRTFRDCFFAYTPSKEEDVLAKFVWNKYEYKHMADKKKH